MISLAVFGVFAIEGDKVSNRKVSKSKVSKSKVSKSKVSESQGERCEKRDPRFESVAAISHRVLEPRT